MLRERIYLLDIGVLFTANIKSGGLPFDLTGWSATFQFVKPNGSTLTPSGTIIGDPLNGKLQWTSTVGTLNLTGIWKWQILLVHGGSGRSIHTNVEEFTVHPVLT